MTDVLTDDDLKTEKAREKRWRNWWLFLEPQWFQCVVCGFAEDVGVGDKRAGHCKFYASVEEATAAARELDRLSDPSVDRMWLGAYPEGERP